MFWGDYWDPPQALHSNCHLWVDELRQTNLCCTSSGSRTSAMYSTKHGVHHVPRGQWPGKASTTETFKSIFRGKPWNQTTFQQMVDMGAGSSSKWTDKCHIKGSLHYQCCYCQVSWHLILVFSKAIWIIVKNQMHGHPSSGSHGTVDSSDPNSFT